MFRHRPGITRRAFLATTAAAAFSTPSFALRASEGKRETLYNGIELAQPWPPRRHSWSTSPVRPPYLASPPAVINIDTGRQLFIDDFLVEESSLYREFHRAEYHPRNPVLTPVKPWEVDDPYATATKTAPSPSAMVFSDGVFFDPSDRLFKMWYMAGYQQHTALAVSNDGIEWRRAPANVIAGTNIVRQHRRDSSTVWLDLNERDAAARFKMAWTSMAGSNRMQLSTSPDGIHWTDRGEAGPVGDRSTFFFNPFRNRWCFSLRHDDALLGRVRRYVETSSFTGATWTDADAVAWVAADTNDRAQANGLVAQLYNVDAVAYESLMLGLFVIFHGEDSNREKGNDLNLAFSRDGFHWSRADRRAFIGISDRQGDWNWANVQSAGGVCLVVGDRLHFYVSGRAGVPGTSLPGRCSTGLATLRRDGFASLTDQWPAQVSHVVGRFPSTLITRPVKFSGGHCFVNADVTGAMRIEVLDQAGQPIAGFTADRCAPIRGDHVKQAVQWDGAALAALAGRTVRFKFTLDHARLFAFWVSPSPRGESRGYLGAGGPGYSGTIDR